MTATRGVSSAEPPSAFTSTGLRSVKYWTMPAVAARTTYPIVSAFPKDGMPTMRSAWPTRAHRVPSACVQSGGDLHRLITRFLRPFQNRLVGPGARSGWMAITIQSSVAVPGS